MCPYGAKSLRNEKNGSIMYKLFILVLTVGGLLFASSGDSSIKAVKKSDSVKSQFCFAEDTAKDDYKLERRRRGGKGGKKNRRGGNGLR